MARWYGAVSMALDYLDTTQPVCAGARSDFYRTGSLFLGCGIGSNVVLRVRIRYTRPMAKRADVDIRRRRTRSHKTAKRLAAKRAMLAARGIRRNSVRFKRAR